MKTQNQMLNRSLKTIAHNKDLADNYRNIKNIHCAFAEYCMNNLAFNDSLNAFLPNLINEGIDINGETPEITKELILNLLSDGDELIDTNNATINLIKHFSCVLVVDNFARNPNTLVTENYVKITFCII